MTRTTFLNRLRKFGGRQMIVSLGEFREHDVHHQVVRRAVDLGLLTKLDRGLYLTPGAPLDLKHRIAVARRRIPRGVVCLETALQFHDVLHSNSDLIWMAIDRKARKPVVKGPSLRFVRFSGDALTQGVVNTRIVGMPYGCIAWLKR